MSHRGPRSALAACLTLVILAAAVAPATATTLRRMDLPEIVTTADRVIHARVTDRTAYWENGQIFTDTTVEVLGEAKGQGPRTVTLKMLGGQVDTIDMQVAGTPEFRIGEEVVLFTYPRPDGDKKVLVGLGQGVMRVREDPATGEKVVISQVHSGVRYVEMRGGRLVDVSPRERRAALSDMMDVLREIAVHGDEASSSVLRKQPTRPETGPEDRR